MHLRIADEEFGTLSGWDIRDKIAASKRKGMWMGGVVPLGYDLEDRHLVVNPEEATRSRISFKRISLKDASPSFRFIWRRRTSEVKRD
jgi:hypothetical protein